MYRVVKRLLRCGLLRANERDNVADGGLRKTQRAKPPLRKASLFNSQGEEEDEDEGAAASTCLQRLSDEVCKGVSQGLSRGVQGGKRGVR